MRSWLLLSVAIVAIAIMLTAGCVNEQTSGQNSTVPESAVQASGQVTKVEVFHFHPTRQCVSCKAVGDLAGETVNTSFVPELASGKLVFRHINYQLPENAALVKIYGVTGSSLMIGVYTPEGFHKEENLKVWYKIGNKEEYMSYLKGVIERRLAGDLS
ncbi:MAG: nitrophenyl compound nitroreductase subunit ArsF family protein [Methanoregulaceae archaeon]|nr:nitrophenyl compound nitroreductase subunit ArsF family protein [Methanoregulaceae archaeon]